MRITTRGRYALRASLALAKLGTDGEPVSINSLAEEEEISSVFLEQIFFNLRKSGIVSSVRGPGGGFCFARSLDKITILDVLQAAGEELEVALCDRQSQDCTRQSRCMSHHIWAGLVDVMRGYFEGITLASILEENAGMGNNADRGDSDGSER